MFESIRDFRNDPIESIYARSAGDSRPHKLDLSIGVYRDATGQATVMQAVRDAETRLLSQARPKSYLSPLGNQRYVAAMESLVFGAQHPALADGRLISAQGPGAGGMLHVGAELIRMLNPAATIWVSDPVWEHQLEFFRSADLRIASYPYYDRDRHVLRFDALLESLVQCRRGDALLIHGCCHNPTGADLSLAQWHSLADALVARGVLPFVDVAYQGFGAGIEADVEGLRLMAARVPEMLVAVSSSKSFTVYRERVGLLTMIVEHGADRGSVTRWLRDLARSIYFMPPDHGACIVAEILGDATLRDLWQRELEDYRVRIQECRARLASALQSRIPAADWNFLRRQRGMFSVLPLDAAQLEALISEHAIYLLNNGRLNFAALPQEHTERVAAAVSAVLRSTVRAQVA